MKILAKILTFFSLVILSLHAQAQVKYSNDFLTLGVGARALSMSKSVVATSNSVTSGYWNPAGLQGVERNFEAAYMHSSYYAGIANFDYLGGSMRLDTSSVIGLSIIRAGVDDIPYTIHLIDDEGNWDYDRISYFSYASYAFLGSYSRKSKIPGLDYGLNVKIIHTKIGDFANAWGFGLDVGVQYQKGKWAFGAMGRDITSTFNAWSFDTKDFEDIFLSTGNDLPENGIEVTTPTLILGAARQFSINDDIHAIAELDFDCTFDGKRNAAISFDPVTIYPHIGAEVDYKRLIYLRVGVGNLQRVETFDESRPVSVQPDFGVGIHYRNFKVDYALTNIASASIGLYSNVFSLIYSFNPPNRQ